MGFKTNNMPGPGDEATWGPCTNHHNDPRTPDYPGAFETREDELLDVLLDDPDKVVEAFTGEAHKTIADHDKFLMDVARLSDSGKDAELGKLIKDTLIGYLEGVAKQEAENE